MRRILVVALATTVGCFSDGGTGPRSAPEELPTDSVPVDTPEGPPRADCSSDERYALILVNNQPLPARSPWGAGEWDYDSDAGTWQVTAADVLLSADCSFTYSMNHRAASGATSTGRFSGRYERSADSVRFVEDVFSASWSAEIIDGAMIERWEGGMTLVYSLNGTLP